MNNEKPNFGIRIEEIRPEEKKKEEAKKKSIFLDIDDIRRPEKLEKTKKTPENNGVFLDADRIMATGDYSDENLDVMTFSAKEKEEPAPKPADDQWQIPEFFKEQKNENATPPAATPEEVLGVSTVDNESHDKEDSQLHSTEETNTPSQTPSMEFSDEDIDGVSSSINFNKIVDETAEKLGDDKAAGPKIIEPTDVVNDAEEKEPQTPEGEGETRKSETGEGDAETKEQEERPNAEAGGQKRKLSLSETEAVISEALEQKGAIDKKRGSRVWNIFRDLPIFRNIFSFGKTAQTIEAELEERRQAAIKKEAEETINLEEDSNSSPEEEGERFIDIEEAEEEAEEDSQNLVEKEKAEKANDLSDKLRELIIKMDENKKAIEAAYERVDSLVLEAEKIENDVKELIEEAKKQGIPLNQSI